jgi:large subunit ribosomal protein L11e
MILLLESMEVCTSLCLANKKVDFYVILARPGGRVAKRKHCRSKIGVHQKVSQSDAITWFKNKYDAVVLGR